MGVWGVANVPITSEKVGAALALTATVYPALQWIKTHLFQNRPQQLDLTFVESVEERFGAELGQVRNVLAARYPQMQLDVEQGQALFGVILDSLILSIHYEDRVVLSELSPRVAKKVEKLRKKLVEIRKDEAAARKVFELRRKLVNELLDAGKSEWLNLGDPFTPETSLDFHLALAQRAEKKTWRTYLASLIDQTVAVGVCGGIFLYQLNHWAVTGELPSFFNWFSR